ncbi:MAG: hypothetical protein J6Y07_00815 [Alphaproteobacteria bacterium]|nr:hypothetical protein [Alphaproteobacteria bacterium]
MRFFVSKTLFGALVCFFAGVVVAYADPTLADYKTVTSKAYVDSLITGAAPSEMTVAEGRTGTATTGRSETAKNLKAIIQGTGLDTVTMTETGVATLALDTTQTGAIASTDTIIGALGKAQGQLNNKQTKKTCYQYRPDAPNNPTAADCWLWSLAD